MEEPPEVTFCASAYFSEEEWRLLHDWQKELYRNVMKEIHQALISLGPLIASTVSTLRAKESDDFYSAGDQCPGRRHVISRSPGDSAADPNVFCGLKSKNPPHLRSHPRSERRKKNDCVSTGFVNTNVLLVNDEEPATIFIDHLGAEIEDSSTEPDMGHELVTFRIKEENETSFLGYEESLGLDGVRRTVGDKIKTRKMKTENSGKNMSRRDSTKFFLDPENATSYDIQMQSDNGMEFTGEKSLLCGSGFHSTVPFNAYQEFPPVQRSQEGAKIKTRKIKTENSGKITSRRDSLKMFLGPENSTSLDTQMQRDIGPELGKGQSLLCGNVSSSTAPFNAYQESPLVESSGECNERGSVQKFADHISCQQEVQLNSGLYLCTECNKSFNRKGNLIKHKQIHTGIRPYQCSECDKSFSRKEHLIVHKRTHSGVKPFCCTICGKSFTQKCVLIRHHRSHTRERPHQCSGCDKRFSRKGNLIKHMKTYNHIR